MNGNPDQPVESPALASAVYAAAKRADLRLALTSIYSRVNQEIESRRPICNTSGRCCKFEEFGHRLYVTTAELAHFVYEWETRSSPAAVEAARKSWNGTGCPFQQSKLCAVHTIRPFGCRIYFCDETAQRWQEDQYERFHAELKSLHARFDVPYFYVEWRTALKELGLAESP